MKRALLSLAMALAVLVPLAASPASAAHDWAAPKIWLDNTSGCATHPMSGPLCFFVVYHLPFGHAPGWDVQPDVVHITWEETAGGHKSSQVEIPFINNAPDLDNVFRLSDLRDNDTYIVHVQYCVKHDFSGDDCSDWGSLSVFTFPGPCPTGDPRDPNSVYLASVQCYTHETSSGLVAVSEVPPPAAAPAPAPAPLPKAPAAPTNFTGQRDAITGVGIMLTWDAVPGTDYYYLTATSHDGNVPQALGHGAPKLSNGTTFFKIDSGDNVANLVGGVDFKLQACNAGGCSTAQTTVR